MDCYLQIVQTANTPEIAEMTKKAIKRRNRNMRSRDKKERRSMHLVGSMVRVKLKKGRKQSRPPQSPASSLREFPTPQRKKNRPLASVIDQMDDDEEDFDEELEQNVLDI